MGLQESLIGSALGADAVSNQALVSAGLGSISAVIAALLTQPMDVLKTKIQVHQLVQSTKEGYRLFKRAKIVPTLSDIYKSAGFRGLWAGCLARAVSAGAGGLLLGPLFEFGQLIADDSVRPTRKPFILPEDP